MFFSPTSAQPPHQAEKKKWCQSELPIGKGSSKLLIVLGIKWLIFGCLSEPTSYEVKTSLSLCFCYSKLSFDMRFEAIKAVLRELPSRGKKEEMGVPEVATCEV